MQSVLIYSLYAVIAALAVVLAIGVLNLLKTDSKARSRSNHLMRLAVQFAAVLIIVAIGWAAGAFR